MTLYHYQTLPLPNQSQKANEGQRRPTQAQPFLTTRTTGYGHPLSTHQNPVFDPPAPLSVFSTHHGPFWTTRTHLRRCTIALCTVMYIYYFFS